MMEGTMRISCTVKVCGVVACLAIFLNGRGDANADDRKVTRIQMTIDELAAQGIAMRGGHIRPFPNSCGPSGNPRLSVSSEFLEHFQADGFTLESLCLGLSSRMHFNPETGQQLPLALVPQAGGDSIEIPLNLPGCFRHGVSDLECDARFDSWGGNRLDPRDRDREFARKFDVMVRRHIQRNQVSGVFKVEDLGQGLFTSSYEWLLASNALPRGYGYALHGPEGDDPELETVDLSTYRKKRDVDSFWNNER
jgi:hypothetical protein